MSYGSQHDVWAVDETVPANPSKKPGIFRRWFTRMCKRAWEDVQYNESQKYAIGPNTRRSIDINSVGADLDREKSIRFNIYIANGGRVVETARYDRKTDRNYTSLYVIRDDQEFGREIDKILVMEGMRS